MQARFCGGSDPSAVVEVVSSTPSCAAALWGVFRRRGKEEQEGDFASVCEGIVREAKGSREAQDEFVRLGAVHWILRGLLQNCAQGKCSNVADVDDDDVDDDRGAIGAAQMGGANQDADYKGEQNYFDAVQRRRERAERAMRQRTTALIRARSAALLALATLVRHTAAEKETTSDEAQRMVAVFDTADDSEVVEEEEEDNDDEDINESIPPAFPLIVGMLSPKYSLKSGQVVAHAALLVRNVAFESQNERWLGLAGACEALVEALNAHGHEEASAEWILWAIVNLSYRYTANKNRMASCGVVHSVLWSGCARHRNNTLINKLTMWSVTNLAYHHARLKQLFVLDGFCTFALDCLRKHSMVDAETTEHICRAVCNISCMLANGQPGNVPAKNRLGDMGACELLSQHVLCVHAPQYASVARSVSTAVRALSTHHNANQERFRRVGAIPLLRCLAAVYRPLDEVVIKVDLAIKAIEGA